MSAESADEKQQAHELIERLEPGQLRALISLVQFMLLDPVSRALTTAPVDDEDETTEEHRAVENSKAWFEKHQGRGVPHAEVLAELGLTANGLKGRM